MNESKCQSRIHVFLYLGRVVYRAHTEQIGCTSSIKILLSSFGRTRVRGCFHYRCVACQALRQIFYIYSRVMFTVHIQYR